MYIKTTNTQQGFTMIELMIALVLGLIIMLAVGQVYVMSVRTASMQQAGSSILDANVFGLQQIERNLRLAGLDLADKSTLEQSGSGIVVGLDNLKHGTGGQAVAGFSADYISKSQVGQSDQLVIQYRAPTDMRDCEGKLVLGPRTANMTDGRLDAPVGGQVVVERYFLADGELRCKAGRYITDDIANYNNTNKPLSSPEHQSAVILGTDKLVFKPSSNSAKGALVVAGIDRFKVQFTYHDKTASQKADKIGTVTPQEYIAGGHGTKPIVAVKMAILARGAVPVTGSSLPSTTYTLLGETVTLNDRHIRRVYESNIMLRNSRGEGLK